MAGPGKRRRLDIRRIKQRRSYTVGQAAELLGVQPGTVRGWIRDGLPTLDERRPLLIMGFAMEAWLKKRREDSRKRCEAGECYCFKCREPTRLASGSVSIVMENEKTVRITGRCFECGTRMNRKGSRAKLTEIKMSFGISKQGHETLEGSNYPLVEHDLEKELHNEDV